MIEVNMTDPTEDVRERVARNVFEAKATMELLTRAECLAFEHGKKIAADAILAAL